jgi:orotidine-5'-phosphate decarboxylase
VLTSDDRAPAELLAERAALAAHAGCGGIVCAAGDLGITRRVAPDLLKVVPGIRPAGTSRDDQARAATPSAALAAGADLLVIGRAVTAADDPERVADALVKEVTATAVAPR